MKRLLCFFKGCTKECILAPLFKMSEALLELFVPLIVKRIIDVGIAGGDTGYIIRMCCVLVCLALAGLLMSVTAQFFSAKAAVHFSSSLRSALFRHIMTLGYADSDSLGTSSLITRMTDDVNILQNGVNLTLRLLLRSPFVVIGAVVMAFTVDNGCAVVFVFTVPVLAAVVFGIMLGTMPLYKKVRQKLDGVMSAARQNLSGVRVIRAFGLEDREKSEFEKRTSEHCAAEKKAGRISALMNPVTYITVNIALALLIYGGAVKVNSDVLTTGAVVALYNYMSQILVELIKLADLIINISKALTSAGRVADVLDRKSSLTYPEKGVQPDFNAPAIEFSNVCLKYGENLENSLEDISFRLEVGHSLGIAGSTGSGKTSLINLIPRFYDASSGSVKLFGNDVKNYDKATLFGLTSVVPQKAVLFSGTVRENLSWGKPDANETEMYSALEVAQALDIINSKKNGLDEITEQGGRNFSGGQRQRLTVARALLKKAPLLILDDSSSALDTSTDRKLRKAISELEYKPAVIIISQRAAAVRDCDNIIVLENGRICASGTHSELIASSEIYRELCVTDGDGAGESI